MRKLTRKDERPTWHQLPQVTHKLVCEMEDSILLQTSRFDASNRHSYLFRNPVDVFGARTPDEIPDVFASIDRALAEGLYVAGFVSYESGYHFAGVRSPVFGAPRLPLVWFGTYEKPAIFDHLLGRFEGAAFPELHEEISHGDTATVPRELSFAASLEQYCLSVLAIKDYISAGDTYQVNFTTELSFSTDSKGSALFGLMQEQQPVAYGALMNIAGHLILSFSPELFFRLEGRRIVTRPMKGTMPRGLNLTQDIEAAKRLQSDEKNRSEHVMIVDLLRNDMGRVCEMGSIRVDDLFSVEKYRTLLQMTSTISGRLRPEVRHHDLFGSLFPSGSVTGAPKIRTMQIIRELESKPRGVYTGAIGFFSPQDFAVFNVAIRTMVMKGGHVQMGVGGGIVADSDPEAEYHECLLKADFVKRERRDFQLIETILWDKELHFLSSHMDRLESSAAYFEFAFDRSAIISQLHDLSDSFTTAGRRRIRMLLQSSGELEITWSELEAEKPFQRITLSRTHTCSTDVFLYHKTTKRQFYERAYTDARAQGFDEVIFTNERGQITEGSITNVFVERDGRLFTPPLECGLLPGICRQHILDTHQEAEETVLTVADMKAAAAVFLCNSVRGLQSVPTLVLDDALVFRSAARI